MKIHSTISRVLPGLLLAAAVWLTSCNNRNSREYYAAEIKYFGFDSVDVVKDYAFYVDQYAQVIFNRDSLPYQTRIDSMFPIIQTYSSDAIYINGEIWKSKQEVDWSKQPVELVNFAGNSRWSKTYHVYVNVHQVDPDSLQTHCLSEAYPHLGGPQKVWTSDDGLFHCLQCDESGLLLHHTSADAVSWTKLPDATGLEANPDVTSLSEYGGRYFLIGANGRLYASTDGQTWAAEADTHRIVALTGSLKGRKYLTDDALTGLVEDSDGLIRFGRYDNQSWSLGELVPEEFPIKEFALTANQTVTGVSFLLITTGRTANDEYAQGTWSTMDGLYWARLTHGSSVVSPRAGAAVFYYDDRLFLLGGNGQNGGDPLLYVSDNHGLDWDTAGVACQMREIPETLSGHQVVADDTYIRIFGGESVSSRSKVWQSYLNRKLFD